MRRWPGSRELQVLLAAAVLAGIEIGCAGRRPAVTPAEAAPAVAPEAAAEAAPGPETVPGPVVPAPEAAPAGDVPAEGEAVIRAIEPPPDLAAPAAPAEEAPRAAPEDPAGTPAAVEEADTAQAVAAHGSEHSLRGLCHQPHGEGFVDESRRILEETFCGATLWFDGLFGGEPDLGNARAVSGRVELSALHTEFDGEDYNGRLRLNYDLPNLERRVRLFLGREDEEDFVTDRREGFAIRSSVFGLESDEEWLAGLGYSPPGRWLNKTDFRVGGKVKSAPEVFVQWRYRQNVFLGEDSVWRLRETLFYENRDGFGSTSSIDVDRVVRRDLLMRWANVGTISEATQGLEWRSAALLYKNLPGTRAIAGELFVRGATDAEVKMREYGTRFVYREPLGRPYLFGEVIVGYTWPRYERDLPREGSTMFGFGFELLFGRDPW